MFSVPFSLSCLTPCYPMDCSRPGFLSITNSQSLLKLMSTESVMPSNRLILCCPLLFLPSIFPSIRVFSNESVLCISWPKYWSFSFSIVPMNIQAWFPLGLTVLISLLSKGLSRVFSSATVWNHQFFGAQLYFLWSSSHIHTWQLEKPQLWLHGPFSAKWCLCFLICCLGWSWFFFQGASVF